LNDTIVSSVQADSDRTICTCCKQYSVLEDLLPEKSKAQSAAIEAFINLSDLGLTVVAL